MKKKSILLSILLCMFIVTACSNGDDGGDSEQSKNNSGPIKLIAYTHFSGENKLIGEQLYTFAELVEEKTGGKVVLQVHTGGDLNYSNSEILDAVNRNLIDIAILPTSEVSGDEPAFKITTLPTLIKTLEEADVFHEIATPHFKELLEDKWNQKYLYGMQWPFSGFWTQEKVEKVDDLKGLKMRTYDDTTSEIVKKLGASPLTMGSGEVYSSLSTGVINSVLTSSQTAIDGKFWEVLDYYMPTNIAAPRHYATINAEVFNKLDKEIQDNIMDAAKEMEESSAKITREITKTTEERVTEEGIETVEISKEFTDYLNKAGEEMITNHMENNATETEKKIYKEYIDKKK